MSWCDPVTNFFPFNVWRLLKQRFGFCTRVVYQDGVIIYRKGNEMHRLDGPAHTHPDGNKSWYIDGVVTRMDKPDGEIAWFEEGEPVRIQEPDGEIIDLRKATANG